MVKPVILTRDNYNYWCDRVRRKIKLDPHAWASVENGYNVMKLAPDAHGDVLDKPISVWTQTEVDNAKMNTKALDIVHDHLDLHMYQMIKNHKIAKCAWEALKSFFVSSHEVRATKVRGIMAPFGDLKMSKNETCDQFFEKIMMFASEVEELGEPIHNKLIVDKLFLRMNSMFENIITTIERTELGKTKDYIKLMGMLKNYEMNHLIKPTLQNLGIEDAFK